MLTAEFKKAYEYTKGLIATDTASIILYILSLIPIVNVFVLTRYVDKIVSEPSSNNKPPKLVSPNWVELMISFLKIFAVAIVWGLIGLVLLLPFALIVGISELTGGALLDVISELNLEMVVIGLVSFVLIAIISIFAVISEVNMLKNGKRFGAAFAFKELLNKISKIGWIHYALYIVLMVASMAIVLLLTIKINDYIVWFSFSVAGIILLFIGTFFAKTISLLYDQNMVASTQ